jgi:hypothetical protein
MPPATVVVEEAPQLFQNTMGIIFSWLDFSWLDEPDAAAPFRQFFRRPAPAGTTARDFLSQASPALPRHRAVRTAIEIYRHSEIRIDAIVRSRNDSSDRDEARSLGSDPEFRMHRATRVQGTLSMARANRGADDVLRAALRRQSARNMLWRKISGNKTNVIGRTAVSIRPCCRFRPNSLSHQDIPSAPNCRHRSW